MTSSVRPPSPADHAWADLAVRLSPASSLDRIDAVTARAVTSITVIGVLLTGLGALSAGQLAPGSAARNLAVAAVIAATLAVACALTAQVLTITGRLNPSNLIEVQAWYRRQFGARARATQAATILLILAALLAGASAATTLLTTPASKSVGTRTPTTAPGHPAAPRTLASQRPSALTIGSTCQNPGLRSLAGWAALIAEVLPSAALPAGVGGHPHIDLLCVTTMAHSPCSRAAHNGGYEYSSAWGYG